MRRVALAALAGALTVLALSPRGRGWLAWGAVVPLFVAVHRATPRATIAATIAYTVTFALAGLEPWFVRATAAYFGVPLARMLLFTVPPLALLAVVHGTILGAMLAFARPRRFGARDVVWCAALWPWWEMLRTLAFPYYPAAFFGLTQETTLSVLQLASVTGVAGISFVVVACNVGFASLIAARGSRDGAVAALTGLALAGGVAAWGAARVAHAPERTPPGPRVVTVDVDARERAAGTLDRYLAASAAMPPDSALVVWPESAFTTDVEHDRAAWSRLATFVGAHGVPLLAGGPGTGLRPGGGTTHYNSAHLIVPGHGMRSYHKRGLVPFAEHWPALAGSPPADLVSLDAGREATVFALGDTAFGVLICFEITGARGARDLVRAGARFIVNLTNDAWFAAAGRPPHLPWAALRAVETGLPVVRAANAGPSTVFDRFGRRGPTSRAGLLAVVVPDAEPTLYARHGDVFLAACLVVVVAGVAAAWRRRATG
jgi:apolipoprotein N-acyltransferase